MTCESNWDYILSPSGGYEIAEDASLHDGCQLVNGVWWAPVFGCDSLETTLERIRERLQRQAAPVAVPSERLRKSQSISSAAQEVLESVASAPTAAAALRAVVQQIDHSWDGAECVDFLQAIAAELGAIIEIDPGPRPVNLSELHDPEFSDGGPNYFPLTS